MIIEFLGVFHLIHSPILILFPFFVQDFVTDVLYITYFLVIMFGYTWVDGECPISLICKQISDKKYVAGKDITYYPEKNIYILDSVKI